MNLPGYWLWRRHSQSVVIDCDRSAQDEFAELQSTPVETCSECRLHHIDPTDFLRAIWLCEQPKSRRRRIFPSNAFAEIGQIAAMIIRATVSTQVVSQVIGAKFVPASLGGNFIREHARRTTFTSPRTRANNLVTD